MCKILTVTGIKQKNQGDLLKFCEAARPILTKYDHDGFGYSATDGHKMWSERWLHIYESFHVRKPVTRRDRELIELFQGSVDIPEKYDSSGVVDETLNSATTIMLHSRMATTSISLQNTHPFNREDISLIHNGVIRNHHSWKKKVSTCDSEALLTKYINDDVRYTPSAIDGLFQSMDGYYACSILAKEKDTYILDVFKCDQAELYFSVIPELGHANVWVTDFTQLQDICEKLGWKSPKMYSFEEYTLVRVNTRTGQPISVTPVAASDIYHSRSYGKVSEEVAGHGWDSFTGYDNAGYDEGVGSAKGSSLDLSNYKDYVGKNK